MRPHRGRDGYERENKKTKENKMKHKPQTILIIAAVAVMLVGATSASAYYERWDGWVNSGSLEYGDDTYNYVEGQGTIEDNTDGSLDTFFITSVPYRSFYCTTTGYSIRLWVHTATGCKDTGQEDQKEVDENATWTGTAKLYDDENHPIQTFNTVVGTWDTSAGGDYFDYDPETPIYSAHWVASYSSPSGITGEGGSEGDRTYYEE
jgi:hypothetical protein